ncbi:protein disulfide isomerase [Colletotrichum truncatum]|uniref:Protein disulfide isomerase n=1 Tax=Colletotrichum truncatum TaxID=5467 RepID=A0ACC3Z7P4_COLTU
MAFLKHVVCIALLAIPSLAWSHTSRLDLEEAFKSRDDTLVAFYSPKCSWNSQLLETEWNLVLDHDKSVLSIDCATDSKTCEEHDVRTYPAIRLYRSAKTFEYYRGPRQAKEIIAFKSRSLRPVVSGLSLENVTSFAYTDSFVFILHLTDQDAGKGLYKRFHDLATTNAHLHSYGVISRDSKNGPSSLDCFNNLDDEKHSTDEFFKHVYSLEEFVKACTNRIVPEMTHQNKVDYTGSKTNVLYFFDFNASRREQFALHIRETARKYKQNLKFVTVDPPAFPDVPASLGIKWTFPAIGLQNKETGLAYHSEQNHAITPGFVENFLRSIGDGTARPAFQDNVDERVDEQLSTEGDVHEKEVVHDEL